MKPPQPFTRPTLGALALSLLVTLFSPTPSAGQSEAYRPPAADSATAQRLFEQWRKMDEVAVSSLRAERYAKGKKKLQRIIDQMMKRMGPGAGGEQALGIILMHRAVAEEGLGHRKAARWDWDVARQLNPSLGEADLEPLGPAARSLAELLPRPAPSLDQTCPECDPEAQVQPPRIVRRPQPDFPRGARFFRITGPIIVQMIITREGEVERPVVLQDLEAATITYAALEAIRDWKFEPARLDGHPVIVYYNLTVNYKLEKR